MTKAELRVLLGATLVVVFDEARANEENIADLDIATGRGRADVDSLGFATGG
jgi:hypothetical protein